MRTEAFRLPMTGLHDRPEHVAVRLSHPDVAPSQTAVLYAHGFGSSQSGEKAEFFRQRFCEAGFTFCSFDFRGHGESEGSSLELTLSRNLIDIGGVAAFLLDHGPDQLILFGSSMGALTELWHAALHPERCVVGLAIAPALGFSHSLEDLLGRETMERWRRDGQMRFVNETGELDVGWEMVEDLRRYSESELAAQLQTPFLFFQGKLDDRVDWRIVHALTQQRPDLFRCELFDDGDHRLINWLDLIWRHSLDFLERHGLQPRTATAASPSESST